MRPTQKIPQEYVRQRIVHHEDGREATTHSMVRVHLQGEYLETTSSPPTEPDCRVLYGERTESTINRGYTHSSTKLNGRAYGEKERREPSQSVGLHMSNGKLDIEKVE